MPLAHYANYTNISEAIVGFCKFCRENQLSIGLNHSQDALLASEMGFMQEKETMRYALKSLFCDKVEDFSSFDLCFDVFWSERHHEYAPTSSKITSNFSRKTNASIVMMGFDPSNKDKNEDKEEAKQVSGASKQESLKYTDFSKIGEIDNKLLDELADKLLHQLNHRLKRKLTTSKQGTIDIRKTIRNNISNGESFIELIKRNRKKDKYRLILLLDVSGSMDKYSFFLLKFILSLRSNLKNIDAFVFSTRLVQITDFVHQNNLQQTLLELGQYANNWSSGTNIGKCLATFNEDHAKRSLNGKSVTIILSDGLDNGDPLRLGEELRKIKMRTSKLVWMNPLKGTEGYEPTAKGMKAALPEIDQFESANTLSSLLELENILAHA